MDKNIHSVNRINLIQCLLFIAVFFCSLVLNAQNSTAFRKNYNYTIFDFPANIIEGLTPNNYVFAGSGIVDGIVSQLNDTGGVIWAYNYNTLFTDINKDVGNNQYFLCGSSSNAAIFLILDLNGNVVLSKKFSISEANDAAFSRVIKTSDGGYVAVGYVTGYDPDFGGPEIKYDPISYTDNNGDSQTDYISSPLIVKLDASGNLSWHKVFRYYTAATKDPATERIYNDAGFNDVIEVSDGYVAVGNYDVNQHRSATNSDGDDATPTDALILKTTTAGVITYHKQIDNPSTSTSQTSKYLSAVNITSAGSVLAGGGDDSRELIQKFAGPGGFSNTFSRLFRYSVSFFTITDPSDVSEIYEVNGSTDIVTMAMYIKPLSFFANSIHRVNSTATTNVWAKRYDFTNMFTLLPRGSLTSDNGYISVSMANGGTNYDFHVIKTDDNGDTPLTGCPANSFSPTASAGPTTFADPYYNSWSGTPGSDALTITKASLSLSPAFVCTKITCTAPLAATTVSAAPASICQGQSTTISASGPSPGTNYNVYDAASGGTFLGAAPLTVSPTSTTTYYVETALISDPGCISTTRTSVSVTVNPNSVPTVTPGGPTAFCQGGSVSLLSSVANSYLWSNGATSQSINVTTAGNYSVTVTYAGPCSNSSSTTTVSVNSNPIPTITPSGATTICQGNNVTLDAGGGYSTYLWSEGSTTQNILVNTSGTFNVTVTDGIGCIGSSGTSTAVTVNPNPTPSISGANSVCSNSNGTYFVTNNPGNSYSWSITNGTINSGQGSNSVSVIWNSSGAATISVTETSAGSCVGNNSMNVTINSSLDPVITASGPATICQNDTVVLDAGSGYSTYLWSTTETTQAISVTASGTYTVSVTDANGCNGFSSSPVTIIVNSNPAPVISASGPTTICEGDSVLLDAGSGFAGYLWSTGETSQTIYVDSIGSYSITVTDANGCVGVSSAPINLDVLSPPQVTITSSDSTTFCEGDSIILNAGFGFSTYLWNTGDTSQTIVVGASGIYSVSVTNSSGCSNDSSLTATPVTVNSLPSATITGNAPVCNGDTVFLLASGGLFFQWNTGGIDSALNVISSGTYVVSVSDSNNCSAVDSVIVTIYPSYSIPVSADICSGDSIFLQGIYQTSYGVYYDSLSTVSGCDSVFITTLAVFPAYSVQGSTSICSGDSIFLQGNYQFTAGNYYDTLFSTGGCDSVVVTALSVNSVFSVSLTDTICSGDSIFLQGNFQTTSGIYYDTLASVGGCDSILGTALTVNPIPAISFAVNNNNLCSGDSASVCATSPTGQNPVWSNGVLGFCFTDSPLSTTFYSITVTDINSCSNSDSVLITVTQTPLITIQGDTITCSNEPVSLIASGGATYQWSTGAEDTNSVNIVNPAFDSTFFVTVSNGVCFANDSFSIIVLPAPDATNAGASPDTTVFFWDDAVLHATGNGNYLWTPTDHLSCSDCADPVANPDSTTVYYLAVTAPNGCVYSDSVILTIVYPESEVFVPNIFSPNNDFQNDRLYVFGRYVEGIEIFIYDRWGEMVYKSNDINEGWDGTYNGVLLNTGTFVYYLKAFLHDGSVYEKQGNTTLLR